MDIMQYNYLVPLIVIIPLVVAVLLVFIRNTFISWLATFTTTLAVLGIISFILIKGNLKTMSYHFGNFAPPFGIEYEVDALTIFFLFLISIVGFLTALWSKGNIIREVGSKNTHLFSAIFLLCFAGSLGIIVTNDLFNLFVFLEITSLTTYILIAMGQRKNSALASFDSLIVGTISASFYVFGVGILYQLFGTLNANDLVIQISKTPMTPMLILAIVMLALGILIKIALFPVCWWLPQTYQSSPSALSSFLAGTSVNIALYMLIKVIIIVIGLGVHISLEHLFELLLVLSVLSMFAGGILAIKQDNLKLLLAFSSISQIGFIVAGISLFSVYSVSSALYLTIVHAFIKSGLFLCVGNLIYIFGTEKLSELRGLGKKAPFTYFAIIFFSLSLAGIPGTSMFWGKLYLLISVIQSTNWILIIAVIIASVLSFLYSWKIIYHLWVSKEESRIPNAIMLHKKTPIYMNIAIGIFILLNIYLTFYPDVTYYFIEQIIHLNIVAQG
jgi:multicomponent Na+:H+ antiporter subunit D